MAFNKILIAIDSSSVSLKAAKIGFELAHQLGANVGLLYAIDESKEMGNPDAGILPSQAAILLKEEATNTIDQLIKLYNGTGSIVHFMPEGNPTVEIINTAKTWEADMLVVGTHARTGLRHFLTGSVSETLIKNISIPVLVVTQHNDE